MDTLKVYVAGKISPKSIFGTAHWRDKFCADLSKKSETNIINLDPTLTEGGLHFDQNNPELIFGRNCFFIKSADLVIAHLTDDISVGGSQEMLLAKYYKKPMIGIAPLGKKFRKEIKVIDGTKYTDWTDPYVAITCDVVVENIDAVAEYIRDGRYKKKVKKFSIVDEMLNEYLTSWYPGDAFAKRQTDIK